ncbi:MAG: sialidase [Ramlibacter sp.]|jgi:sialidase-1|nr:sialidase [Ramlibacter sp.]
MPAITITDLNNAKTDVDHLATVATSLAPTATDRLGHVKKTISGMLDGMQEQLDDALDTAEGSIGTQVAAAAASRSAIDNRIYPGTYASAPTTRPDTSAIQNGDTYFGTDGYTYVRVAGAWVNQTSAAAASASAAAGSASASSGSAADSNTAKLAAQAAQTLAETARDSAWGTARLYATTAAALADGTLAVGQYFAVLSGVSSETAIIYLKAAGPTATDTGKRVPSSLIIQASASGALHEDTDSADVVVQAMLPDGTVLSKLRPKTLAAPASMTIGKKTVTRVIQEDPQATARRELSLWVDKALARTESAYAVTNTTVMSNALDGTSFLQNRMAGAQMCADGTTVLCFGFTSENSTDDFGRGSLTVKRITWNKTTRAFSLGSLAYLGAGTTNPEGAAVEGRWISLTSVVLHTGPNKGRVFLMYCWQETDGTDTRVFTQYSDDHGVTWSARTEITSQFPPMATEWGILAPGPATSIQLRHGDYAGRIVVPAWHGCPQYPNDNTNLEEFPETFRAVLLYSDDYGANWSVGVRAPRHLVKESNECAIAEDWRGDILWTMRATNYTNSKPMFKVTAGGTALASDPFVMVGGTGATITTSQVMCGLIQAAAVDPMKSSAPKLLLSLPNSTTREKVTLYASYDGGTTWPASCQITAGGSAYSMPVVLDDRTIGVFWEDSSYTTLRMSVLNLTTLLGA